MKSVPDEGLSPFLATLETTSLARGEGKITGRAMVLSAASDACESTTRDTLAALWRRLRTISWAGRLTEIAILDCAQPRFRSFQVGAVVDALNRHGKFSRAMENELIVLPRWLACCVLVVALLAPFCSTALASGIQWYLTKGAIAIANLEFERAIDVYSKGLEQQPSIKDRAELLMARGLAFDLAKKPDRTEVDYTAAIDLVGDSDPRAYRHRGYFYYYHDRLDRALADYSAGAKFFPKDGDFPNGQGLTLSNQGKFDEAIGRFDEAIRLDPKSGSFYLGRAEAYNRSYRPQRALEDYTKALAGGDLSKREIQRLRAGRGHAQFRLQNYDAAIADFNAVLGSSPDFVNVLKWRGLCYERLGDTGNAIRDYEATLKLDPSEEAVAKRLQELRGK